jgi:hypothetical protein
MAEVNLPWTNNNHRENTNNATEIALQGNIVIRESANETGYISRGNE